MGLVSKLSLKSISFQKTFFFPFNIFVKYWFTHSCKIFSGLIELKAKERTFLNTRILGIKQCVEIALAGAVSFF